MRALIVIDVQNDFMPFGALPVAEGDAVVSVVNALMPKFDLVVATQDWHPADHGSFASAHIGRAPGELIELGGAQQVLWPEHCVQNTPGASFHAALDVAGVDAVVRKGTDPAVDSYSGFFDNAHVRDTGLDALLGQVEVKQLWLAGLATDYCVKYTALDARELGYEVTVVADATRAVNLEPGDGDAALEQMRTAGCRVVTAAEVW